MRRDTATILKQFEEVSAIYRAHLMEPAWSDFDAWETDGWDGLGVFLGAYAFEHLARSPEFAPAAKQAVRELRDGSTLRDPLIAGNAWRCFVESLSSEGETKLNVGRNPLAPKGLEYEFKYKQRRVTERTKKESAIEVAAGQQRSFPVAVRDLMARGDTAEAHALVESVNGVGRKIASFFLRDVACKTGLVVAGHRELLQPVDIWVRRATERVLDLHFPGSASIVEVTAMVAREIVEACEDVGANAEHVNQGMWYFGQRVCGSKIELTRALKDEKEFRAKLVALRDAGSECNSIVGTV